MYIGPEVIMPLASALAAVAGVLLMFWRRALAVLRAVGQGFSRTFSRIFSTRRA